MPPYPAQGQALDLALSVSTMHIHFSLLYRVRERFPEPVQHAGPSKARHMPPPWPSCLRSSAPSPGTPSLSAGLCLCWLGLPPTLPGLADRGRTHRVSSHCRSTGRARAPPAEAAARLPHRHPPSHPLAMNLGSLGGTTGCSSQQAWLCEVMGSGPIPLPVWQTENMWLHSGHLYSSHSPRSLQVPCSA